MKPRIFVKEKPKWHKKNAFYIDILEPQKFPIQSRHILNPQVLLL